MGLLTSKKGIIMGIANERSIASAIARTFHQEGALLGFSHLPDKDGRCRMEQRLNSVVAPLNPALIAPCDVSDDQQIDQFFLKVNEIFGSIDFIIHSIAYAPSDDIKCKTIEASRQGFHEAMDISVYSLLSIARASSPFLNSGGSIITMSYYGGEKVLPGYNLMGLCKAALECSVKYLAYDFGPSNVRVNAISAGPIKTLASSAVGNFKSMLDANASIAPLKRNITSDEVAKCALYLASDLSSGTTGEIIHVDAGYNVMGGLAQISQN